MGTQRAPVRGLEIGRLSSRKLPAHGRPNLRIGAGVKVAG